MSNSEFPPRFTLEPSSVLRLFTGDTFYSSADAAIREAVLNAIDATARAQDTFSNVTVEISVLFDRSQNTVTIADNGIGMTKSDASDFFAKVGASAARIHSAAPSSHHKLIGEFGIGVMSYFLVGEEFEVHTKTESEEAFGLKFSRQMLDAETPSEPIATNRSTRGTTVVLRVREPAVFDLLVQKFPHWVRNVDGLSGRLVDEDTAIEQGGLSHSILPVDVEHPDWIFHCSLGPPTEVTAWYTFDGRGHIDVLYSGVFVERVEIEHLWGIEGSIFVDPKKFRPKLNREGFVGGGLRTELEPFLRRVHPQVLARASELLRDTLADNEGRSWTTTRLATLWLAIPRSSEYAEAAKRWDEEFRARKILRQLLPNGQDQLISAGELIDAKPDEIFVASINWSNQGEIIRSAVRLLRDQGKIVIVGVERDSGYLSHASFAFGSTEAIVMNRFASQLPRITTVSSVADGVLRRESLIDVLIRPVVVKVVPLGSDASAILIAGNEIWINANSPAGRNIALYLCDNAYGLSSLIAACLKYAPEQIQGVANLFRGQDESCFYIGPLRRQAVRLKLQ